MMDEENIKRSLSFGKFSRNQVSPVNLVSKDQRSSFPLHDEVDDRFICLPNECQIFKHVPPTNDPSYPETLEPATAHVADTLQKTWNFPRNPELIIRLIGSYNEESRSKGNILFSIRDFLTELIQLTVKEELWMYIDGEDFSLFKSFGNLLQSITLPASDFNPAVFGVINSNNTDELIDENSELVKNINPKIKRYILTDQRMRHSIKKEGWLECTILCNGTKNSMEEIINCIENKHPIIILKGSGGIADIMSEILGLEEAVSQKDNLEFCIEALLEKTDIPEHLSKRLVDQLINNGGAYGILNIGGIISQSTLEQSLLRTLYHSCKDDRMFLKLALKFDQLDLAAEIGQLWKLVDNNDYESCRCIISEAMRLKRYNFVRYMIEQGMDPVHYIQEQDITKTFLLAVKRERRYNETMSVRNMNCLCLRNQADDESLDISLFDSEKSFQKQGKSKKKDDLIELISKYCGQKRIYNEDYKIERLFKLAILKRKFELSELFWRYVKYPIGGALFACLLLDVMRKQEEKSGDLDIIQQQKKKYETFAINTLNNTYAKYPEDAMNLLSQTMPQWTDKSCITLALEMGNKEFIAQKACQDLNERTWRNNLALESYDKPDGNGDGVTFLMWLVSPRMKAFFDFVGLLVFLVVYGVLLVSYLEARTFHPLEWIVWSFIVCYSLEWIRKIKSDSSISFKTLEVLKPVALLLFICGFFVKVGAYYDNSNLTWMDVSRVMLSFDYILFCLCLLDFYYISKFLGPLLLTINIMTKILFRFFLIIIIFYVAFAIAAEAALYPVSQPNGKLFYFMNKRPFWSIFGEFSFDEFDTSSNTCTDNANEYNDYEKPRCPTQTGIYYVPIIMAFYVVVINILLLNLLIAAFNSAIKKTEKQSYNIWCYQKLQFTLKYQSLLILPPPFAILWPVFLYFNRKEKNKTFTLKEIRDDYEAQKLKRIQTEQRDIILKDVEVKTAQSMAPTETEPTCPHKDVGDIGIDLMLKLKSKVKKELQHLTREVKEMKESIQKMGYTPNSTFSVDEDEFDVNERNFIFDHEPTESKLLGSAGNFDSINAKEDTQVSQDPSVTEGLNLTDVSQDSSDNEEKKLTDEESQIEEPQIINSIKEPDLLFPRYGNIIATRLSPEAEAIMRKRKPTKTPRKYFACRTNYKYGVRWKIISVKKKTKLKPTDVPLSARTQKPVKKSVSDAVDPYLKLL